MKNRNLKIFNTLARFAEVIEPVGRIRLTAAIVSPKGDVVSIGIASRKTHPLQRRFQKNKHCIYLHAEIDAIRRAIQKGTDLSQCSLYVCRIKQWELKNKKKVLGWGNACPCKGCQAAIKFYNIKRVYYTLDGISYSYAEVINIISE